MDENGIILEKGKVYIYICIYVYITANHLKIEASQILNMQGKKHRLAICSNDFESDNYFCLCQADDTKRTP